MNESNDWHLEGQLGTREGGHDKEGFSNLNLHCPPGLVGLWMEEAVGVSVVNKHLLHSLIPQAQMLFNEECIHTRENKE